MTTASTRPETAGLMALYHGQIAGELEGMESERRKAVGQAALALVVGLVLSAVVWSFFGNVDLRLIALPAMLGLGGGAWIIGRISSKTKGTLVPRAFAHMGWQFSDTATEPSFLKTYLTHKMLPKYTGSSFEDRVQGRVGHAEFAMTEVRLVQSNGKSTVTVFQGFVMDVDFHQSFNSTTIVLRDRGLLNKSKMGHLKRVGMASAKWEKLFEAYSTDQVEARVKLDPDFMERLMALEDSVDGKRLRFGFFDNRLHVIVETPDRFEPGSMFKPLADPARMERLIGEIEAIMAVVEGVQKPGRRWREALPDMPMRPPLTPMPDVPANPYSPAGHVRDWRSAG